VSTSTRVAVTPREAAALHRLLQTYLVTEEGDAGMADLATFYVKVDRIEQDHTAYDQADGAAPAPGRSQS
jgi:hypothetical protein